MPEISIWHSVTESRISGNNYIGASRIAFLLYASDSEKRGYMPIWDYHQKNRPNAYLTIYAL